MYRVAQDCSDAYGKSLSIILADDLESEQGRPSKLITPQEINLDVKKKITGVHTYNICEQMEVIDVKYESYSLYHLLCRVRAKARGLLHG